MVNYINQYKLVFVLLWIVSYFVYPSWALPVSITSRYVIFSGLLIYFLISWYFLNAWLKTLDVDQPFAGRTGNYLSLVQNNVWLSVVCFAAFVLHIYPILTRPLLILGDEALHIQGGLWIYDYVDNSLHIYIQLIFWSAVGLVLFLTRKGMFAQVFLGKLKRDNGDNANLIPVNAIISALFGIAVIYFLILHNLPFHDDIVRYPPLSRWLYFILYSAFGINYIWPRFLQLTFYILSAVYLYRLLMLFSDKRTALLGSSIFLFFPVAYIYASLAEMGCGTVFFIILISYHFLRYMKVKDGRDIILASFFTGAGFLYKRSIFVMVFVCAAYLILNWLKNRDSDFFTPFKVMLLSMVPIVPWMIIGKFFTWRNYKIVWSNFIPPDGKVFSYFMHLPFDMSWMLFGLFVLSLFVVLIFRRNIMTLFFLLLLIAYYFFYAIDMAALSPRLSMAFYPTIAVYTAVFLSAVVNKIKWRHSYAVVLVCLLGYLSVICAVPPFSSAYLQSVEFQKLQNFPTEKAMQWVKDNVAAGERVLTLRIMSALFYRDKYEIMRDKIVDLWFELGEVSTRDRMRKFVIENNITYIMFPYGPDYPMSQHLPVLKNLKENRDNEFVLVRKFNTDDNLIYIYKMKERVNSSSRKKIFSLLSSRDL